MNYFKSRNLLLLSVLLLLPNLAVGTACAKCACLKAQDVCFDEVVRCDESGNCLTARKCELKCVQWNCDGEIINVDPNQLSN